MKKLSAADPETQSPDIKAENIAALRAIFRYLVKSMSGERLEVANLGWYGLDSDRRFRGCHEFRIRSHQRQTKK